MRILLIGAREKTVKPWALLIRKALTPGAAGFERFQETFPEILLDKSSLRTQMEFTIPARTAALADPTFRASYVGVSGAGWRCDILKFDDPVERRNVTNPEMSMKIFMQMMDLYQLLDDTGKYENITGSGTRWAYHDPYGAIIGDVDPDVEIDPEVAARLESGKCKVMVRHGLEDPNQLCERCPPHIVKLYPHGNPSMDEGCISCDDPIHSVEAVWADYRKHLQNPTMGESMFWHQIMNICLAPGDERYKKEWFMRLAQPTFPVVKRRVLAVDSADKDFQKKGQGDWMVAIFGDFDDFGRLNNRWGLRSNSWTRAEFIRRILTYCHATEWWPHMCVKEKFGTDTFLSDLRDQLLQHHRPAHMVAYSRPDQLKKLDWIVEQTQTPFENGEVVFGSDFPQELYTRISYEACNLGQVAHEDVMDTEALFFIPEVRIKPVTRMGILDQQWHAPDMSLYDISGKTPSHKAPDEEPSGVDRLRSEGGSLVIGPDMDPRGGDVRWDPPPVSERMNPGQTDFGTGLKFTK